MIDTKNNVSIFENHTDDFFEYAARQTQITEKDPLCEVKQYLAMARDFLAIPATSVISEQMFSCTGRIIDDSCTSLDTNTIAALICQKI
ncbi:21680_t:CDS:2, partial [Dentiscutata erythropus]